MQPLARDRLSLPHRAPEPGARADRPRARQTSCDAQKVIHPITSNIPAAVILPAHRWGVEGGSFQSG